MMKLTPGRRGVPTTRETEAKERGDPLVVDLHPRYLTVRVKGHPTQSYNLDYELLLAIGRRREFAKRGKL
jgi:hypothetical protein